ncbi:GNAT family N-acetyltransferase [Ensifer sp. ENS05]|uniref:acyl-homoserine-lactone synthase n=1 Tax=Ensifer sp. ENS05 TaxID=2769277 RepID=UPI0017828B32|nr:acyl-homoserine-lactone synthase [Ensifer sp. ENS05]MBD9597764.1 GNAT family N-acetyltransferase [Ensifer sp. ENS05]
MLKVLTKRDHLEPSYDEMLRGRAKVFAGRLNWEVHVRDGKEFDYYDLQADPVYLVSLGQTEGVTGSLRLLPTTGATMLKSEFSHMFREAVDVEGPAVWECTRLCVHPASERGAYEPGLVALQLLSGLCDFALGSGVKHIVGVYEAAIQRVYRRLGWSPKLLSLSQPQFGRIGCGLWEVSLEVGDLLRERLTERGSPLLR